MAQVSVGGAPASAQPNSVVFDRWFAIADADCDGRVTGQDAVLFFARSGLPKDVLARVWELANTAKQGFLDRMSFHKSMELIAMAQAGVTVTRDNYEAAKVRQRPQLAVHASHCCKTGPRSAVKPVEKKMRSASMTDGLSFRMHDDVHDDMHSFSP